MHQRVPQPLEVHGQSAIPGGGDKDVPSVSEIKQEEAGVCGALAGPHAPFIDWKGASGGGESERGGLVQRLEVIDVTLP